MDSKHVETISQEIDLRIERRRLSLQWKALFACYAFIMFTGSALLYLAVTGHAFQNLPSDAQENAAAGVGLSRRWGGFEERPMDNKCYRQERTAMLLSFILGSFGVDQFYAHHWPLAVFKMLSGMNLLNGVILAVVTQNPFVAGFFASLTSFGTGIWWFVDVILWMVGGVYGTPGCPGGSRDEWRY